MDLNSSNALLHVHLKEIMKVAKFVVVQIMGFMENERTFLTLTFMKVRLENKLCEHLDLVIHIYAQLLDTIDTFLNDVAITLGLMRRPKKVFWLNK
jgi:hypothetical protein